ncbi:MAG: hypothetical protein AAF388_07065 [Bacteroidota bacterium]
MAEEVAFSGDSYEMKNFFEKAESIPKLLDRKILFDSTQSFKQLPKIKDLENKAPRQRGVRYEE